MCVCVCGSTREFCAGVLFTLIFPRGGGGRKHFLAGRAGVGVGLFVSLFFFKYGLNDYVCVHVQQ